MRHDKDTAERLLKSQVGNLDTDFSVGGLLGLLLARGGRRRTHHHHELAKLGLFDCIGRGKSEGKEESTESNGRKHGKEQVSFARLGKIYFSSLVIAQIVRPSTDLATEWQILMDSWETARAKRVGSKCPSVVPNLVGNRRGCSTGFDPTTISQSAVSVASLETAPTTVAFDTQFPFLWS